MNLEVIPNMLLQAMSKYQTQTSYINTSGGIDEIDWEAVVASLRLLAKLVA
jgi:hypothetical protein